MATMPKTGLRTPAEYTDPFMPQFDDETATDLDNFLDANAADLKQVLYSDSYDALPWYDEADGKAKWGDFEIGTSRYTNRMTVAAGEIAMSGNQVLYVDVPTNRPYGGAVVPAVGSIPQTGRDRVAIGILIGGTHFFLIGKPEQSLLGYGPGPGLIKSITSPTTLNNSDSGRLIVVNQGVTVTLPKPDSKKSSFFIKCNGTGTQFCTIAGGLGDLGFIGPHELLYGAWNNSIRMYGAGGLLRLVAHEPVPGSGYYGWLVRGETGHYQNATTPSEEWYLDGASAAAVRYHVGSSPPGWTPGVGDLWFCTATGWNILMYWDGTRSKWLSVETEILSWAHDSADGNALRGFGIDAAGAGTGYLVHYNACICEVSARARGGNLTKAFRLDKDNAGTPVTISSFSLVGGTHTDKTLNVNLVDGDDIWAYSDAAGAASEDVTVSYVIRRRWQPPPS